MYFIALYLPHNLFEVTGNREYLFFFNSNQSEKFVNIGLLLQIISEPENIGFAIKLVIKKFEYIVKYIYFDKIQPVFFVIKLFFLKIIII